MSLGISNRAETRGGAGFDDRQNFSGKSSLDPNMLNPVPSALQKAPLTGGANQSPQEQAQTSTLFNPTPLENQKYTPEQQRQMIIRGATDPSLRPQVNRGVPTSNETMQPTGIIPGSVNQTNTLPIPGYMNEEQKFVQSQLNNPTTLATAIQFMRSLPPPRTGTGTAIMNAASEAANQVGLGNEPISSPMTWAKAAAVIGQSDR